LQLTTCFKDQKNKEGLHMGRYNKELKEGLEKTTVEAGMERQPWGIISTRRDLEFIRMFCILFTN
jgi:hypothetical protein